MRSLALPLMAAICLPALGAKPVTTELVTVAQLEQTIASARLDSDGAAAKLLSHMRLTQRISEARLDHMVAALPGHQAREQLLVLADESAFLQLPTEDVLPDPPPDAAAKSSLLEQAAAYLKDIRSRWPSFSAVRDTTRFEGTSTVIASGLSDDLETPVGIRMLLSPAAENWECPNQPRLPSRRVDKIEHASVPMLYRRGHLVQAMSPGGEFACTRGGVNTLDEFKEFLVLLPLVLKSGKAAWDHWEQAGSQKLAVFRFAATVKYAPDGRPKGEPVEFEGEIAINPSDGSIERMAQVRRWQVDGYSREYDTAEEFAPEQINGARYLLPSRRVAMFLTPILKPRTWDDSVENTYKKFHLENSPLQEYLNDVRFTDYRPYDAPAASAEIGLAANVQP